MLDDISKQLEESKNRRHQQGVRDGYATRGGFAGVLSEAAQNNKVADKDFVKACVGLVNDRWAGRLNQKQFLEGCDYLDEVAKQLSR